jgi:hypothetical protein
MWQINGRFGSVDTIRFEARIRTFEMGLHFAWSEMRRESLRLGFDFDSMYSLSFDVHFNRFYS